jgi:hypothetical protein
MTFLNRPIPFTVATQVTVAAVFTLGLTTYIFTGLFIFVSYQSILRWYLFLTGVYSIRYLESRNFKTIGCGNVLIPST